MRGRYCDAEIAFSVRACGCDIAANIQLNLDIFTALPWVNFILVGDDGERDPETFQALKDKYPERVAAIYIRKVHPDPQRKTYTGQMDLSDGIKGR